MAYTYRDDFGYDASTSSKTVKLLKDTIQMNQSVLVNGLIIKESGWPGNPAISLNLVAPASSAMMNGCDQATGKTGH